MELKYTNPNGGIVLASKLNHPNYCFFGEKQKLHLEMNPIRYFFQEDAITVRKTRMFITFS